MFIQFHPRSMFHSVWIVWNHPDLVRQECPQIQQRFWHGTAQPDLLCRNLGEQADRFWSVLWIVYVHGTISIFQTTNPEEIQETWHILQHLRPWPCGSTCAGEHIWVSKLFRSCLAVFLASFMQRSRKAWFWTRMEKSFSTGTQHDLTYFFAQWIKINPEHSQQNTQRIWEANQQFHRISIVFCPIFPPVQQSHLFLNPAEAFQDVGAFQGKFLIYGICSQETVGKKLSETMVFDHQK